MKGCINMKKVIKGKVYDTEKAEKVGEYWNGIPSNDFRYCYEVLYKKKTGELFLYGTGGAMSRYHCTNGDNWSGDERIIPLSYKAAQQWAEANLDGDEYEKIFGFIDEDSEDTCLNITISAATKKRLNKYRSKYNLSYGQIIEKLVEKFLEEN